MTDDNSEFHARQRSRLGPEQVPSTTQSGERSREGPTGATYTAQFDAPLTDIFGDPWVAAPPEVYRELETAAVALAAVRTWALGRHDGRCQHLRVDIKTSADGDLVARFEGVEYDSPYLTVARDDQALTAALEEDEGVRSLHVPYAVNLDGALTLEFVHFEGWAEQPISAREGACLLRILRAMSQLGVTRPVVVHDGIEVSLRAAPLVFAVSRWQDVGRGMLEQMVRWAEPRPGMERVHDEGMAILSPALCERTYLFGLPWPSGRSAAEDFRAIAELDDDQRAWLDAAIAAWTSYWVVTSIADGLATLRDMFTREIRVVPDDGLLVGMVLCARVVTFTEGAYIDASDSMTMDRKQAADLRFAFADLMDLPKAKPVKPEAMRAPRMALELAVFWQEQFDDEMLVEL